MSEDKMLYCLIAFIFGWLASRQMGNGFNVGGQICQKTNNNFPGDCDALPGVSNHDGASACNYNVLGQLGCTGLYGYNASNMRYAPRWIQETPISLGGGGSG